MWFWIAVICGGLIGLVVLFALLAVVVGLRFEKNHVASRTIRLRQSPETIWTVITDHANEPAWHSRIKTCTQLPDRDGHEAWEVQYKGAGNPPMTLTTTQSSRPNRLVRTIDDSKKVFSGRWEFILAGTPGGALVTITEHGEIPNPFFRGMFRMFADPATYIEQYLKALAGKFGEEAVFDEKT